jgi:hypothetical protein
MTDDRVLPAFANIGDQTELWPESPAMGWSQANALGRERAEDLLETMRRTDAPNLLGHVVEAMVKRGVYDGVAVGFCQVLAVTLMQPPVVEFVEVPVERTFPIGRKKGPLALVG